MCTLITSRINTTMSYARFAMIHWKIGLEQNNSAAFLPEAVDNLPVIYVEATESKCDPPILL